MHCFITETRGKGSSLRHDSLDSDKVDLMTHKMNIKPVIHLAKDVSAGGDLLQPRCQQGANGRETRDHQILDLLFTLYHKGYILTSIRLLVGLSSNSITQKIRIN